MLGLVGAVETVHFLTQHRALERATGFAFFVQRQGGWKHGVIEQRVEKRFKMRCIAFVRRAIILRRQVTAELLTFAIDASVKPGFGVDGRHEG